MSRWSVLFSVSLFCFATLAAAQAPPRPTDPVFTRAQALVSDGNGVAGRALIDSVIAATQPTARLYPEALFWRATLAANAADAESDYKHIVVDYPLAPQAEDALLRLAQLELARGDRDGALGHLQRIPRDYPRSKSLARASYWTARVLFEKNDVPNACAANANAMAQADASQVELRNQIQYQGQRCPAAVAEASPPMTGVSANSPATSVTASTTPRSASAPTPSVTSAVPTSVADASKGEKPRAIDTTTRLATAPSTEPKTVISPQRPKPPIEANDSKPSIVDPAKAPKAAAEKMVAKASTISSRGNGYSVQVAAYNHKADAEKFASGLTKRGYAARVDGSVAPFRVRIGRYTAEKEAEDALTRIKAKHMDGFVVRAPER
ncbi:MAG TPA: SPOR domain-containing protein [Gemmatimonadaceae bacterium]